MIQSFFLVDWYVPKWEITEAISLYDVFLAPLYILLIYLIAYLIKSHRYKNTDIEKYLLPGLTVKIFAGMMFGAVYSYYYGGGDTFYYYKVAEPFYEALRNDPLTGIELITLKTGTFTPTTFPYTSRIWSFYDGGGSSETVFMGRFIALIEFFSFRSYWLTTILLSTLSYTGMWQLYKLFATRYPAVYKELAFAILFVPSVLFWGSGILKDTVCLMMLGWFVYSFDKLSSANLRSTKNVIILAVSAYIIFKLKAYIILAFLPAAALGLFARFKPKQDAIILKYLSIPIAGIVVIGGGAVLTSSLASASNKYDIDQLENRAEGFRTYHQKLAIREGQSYYSLGEVNYTPLGILSKAPLAINVTYFRPYFWEVNEPLQYLSAFESLVVFLIFLRLLIRHGPILIYRACRNDYLLLQAFTYSLFFGLAVGLTAYNFGALVRFKTAGIVFLIAFIVCAPHFKATKS